MDAIQAYLPPHVGLLPKWLLFVSIVSVGNSIQAYTSLGPTRKVYAGPKTPGQTPSTSTSPVTPLSARTFGTWTFISAVVRLYAAYYITNPQIYQLAFTTYVVAFLHFFSEWLVFGTARAGPGLLGPAVVSTASLSWMWLQWGYYVG
ncbi:ergosterol 28 [Tothia fuscella]|uniref:Ergosterol 28 n=1 Tax=Tothia fuscella TaxID=1048955 RepID=A0A9P4TUR6_9PEZI|nr:ergosterol 28 [Tothia fuscella]